MTGKWLAAEVCLSGLIQKLIPRLFDALPAAGIFNIPASHNFM